MSAASAADTSAQAAPAAARTFLIVLILHRLPAKLLRGQPAPLALQMHRPAFR
jgi:hypothetical protein